MIYCGTSMTETIWFRPEKDYEEIHYIELHKADDESIFYVTTCCNDDWVWTFNLNASSNYEMVKFTIMEAAFGCCCINNLLDTLDEIFEEEFLDILAENKNECNECNCENCNHRDCLN